MPTTYAETCFPFWCRSSSRLEVAGAMIGLSGVIGRHVRDPIKSAPYESGMAPVGNARERFSVKFYLVAMVFILFDIEAIFLYPWAVVYPQFKLFAFFEMLLFIVLVLCGFFYILKRWARLVGRPGAESSPGGGQACCLTSSPKMRRLANWSSAFPNAVVEAKLAVDGTRFYIEPAPHQAHLRVSESVREV